MILYYKGAFGLNLLGRVHGSAVYRALLPGLVSVGIYLAIALAWRPNQSEDDGDDLNHPYAIGIFVSSVAFLIVFRANFGYQRYWEACTAVFNMQSKWMDAASHTASFHMQCDHYDEIRPPSFYDYPELKASFLTRDRERMSEFIVQNPASGRSTRSNGSMGTTKSINRVSSRYANLTPRTQRGDDMNGIARFEAPIHDDEPTPLIAKTRLDGGWKGFYPDAKTTFYDQSCGDEDDIANIPRHHDGFASTVGGVTPPLFLQELGHLTSLLCAVALSTLRNDVEGGESPLSFYSPGAPWPPVNAAANKERRDGDDFRFFVLLKHWLGFDRTPEARTKWNASHPLPVLGGVSDAEIFFLQLARGPSAKTQLAFHWLSEFITREHLAGSLGEVGSPIISRVMQFLGDGNLFYNQARKIMFIPFPFPHAQLSAFAIVFVTFAVPFMMEQYTNEVWLGVLLSFFTVTCLAGLHEVARELENPFRNVPNDIPLITLQAMFNESLLTIYSGYHPDAYWDPDLDLPQRRRTVPNMRQSTYALRVPDEVLAPEGQTDTNDQSGLSDLQELVMKQSKDLSASQKELGRLRTLVEGNNASKNCANGTKMS